jgi:hypothetical protein
MLTVACSATPDGGENRMPRQPAEQVTTDPAVVAAALEFGGIVLPASASVLGVQYDRGVDERYRVVIRVAADGVSELLSGSGFVGPLVPDAGPFQASVDGFDLATTTAVESATDSVPPGADRPGTVFRELAVDRSTPAEPVVHLWLFTT